MENSQHVNVKSKTDVVALLQTIFQDSAFIDEEVVDRNILLASKGGMSKEDRSIRAELANYLLDHFSTIYLVLLISNDVRLQFVKAVDLEITMDEDMSEGERQAVRQELQDDIPEKKSSKGNYVINLSLYNKSVSNKVSTMILDSINKNDNLRGNRDYFESNLDEDAMVQLGFCFSNFMYLIRAFAHNDLFTEYVKDLISSIEKQLAEIAPKF